MNSSFTIWKRIERIFRTGGLDFSSLGPVFVPSRQGRLEPLRFDVRGLTVKDRSNLPAAAPTPAARSSWTDWLPWSRRHASVTELREGYARMLDLLDAVKTHFDTQDRRATELTSAVNQVAGTLEQLAAAQKSQGDNMATIARQVDGVSRAAGPLMTGLVELPASLQAQADAVRNVARRLEATHAGQGDIVSALDRFGQSGETLRQAGEAQVQTLARLSQGNQQLHEALTAAIRQQSRRMTLLVAIVGTVSVLIVAGLGVLALILLTHR